MNALYAVNVMLLKEIINPLHAKNAAENMPRQVITNQSQATPSKQCTADIIKDIERDALPELCRDQILTSGADRQDGCVKNTPGGMQFQKALISSGNSKQK